MDTYGDRRRWAGKAGEGGTSGAMQRRDSWCDSE